MKIALITGTGNRLGLGFATAKQLAALGFHVILTARKAAQIEPLAAELASQGLSASVLPLDLTDDDSVYAAVQAVKQQFGKLDVLVNNAALMLSSNAMSIIDKDLNELRAEFETNVIGTWRVTQQFYPLLKASGHGRIVNVSSGAGSFTDPDYGLINGFSSGEFKGLPITAYALTKLTLNGLTIKMAKEFKADNILVNAVCPDLTASREGTERFARSSDDSAKGVVWAATLPDNGETGGFFRDGNPLQW